MVADSTTVMAMRESLQKFYGAKHIMCLDLSSAFLQALLEHFSRQFTAFKFESNVYRFATVPYGFKNSLPVFIRALELFWGESGQNNNLVICT